MSPAAQRRNDNGRSRPTGTGRSLLDRPLWLLVVLIGTAVAAELLVLVAARILPGLPTGGHQALDVLILVAFLVPTLVVLVYQPLRRQLAERERTIRELEQSEKRFRDITDNAQEWIWEVDPAGRYTFSSAAVEKILGYPPEQVVGRHFYDLFHPDERDHTREAAMLRFAARKPFRGVLNRDLHRDGRSVWLSVSGVPILDALGALVGYRGAAILRYDEGSLMDPVTGLVNRTGFELLAEQQLRISLRTRTPATLVFVDLDGFKAINDRHGHAEGDRALADVAEQFRRSVRASDVVSRIGGDEFVLLLPGTTAEAAERLVDKLRANVARWNEKAGRPYRLDFSCGAVQFDPAAPVELTELLRTADAAMYANKRRRRTAG